MSPRHVLVGFAAAALLAACTIRLQLPQASGSPQEVATTVALTLQAADTSGGPYQTPMLEITANTNCRSGPGGSYDLITSFAPGTKLEIVGRYSATNFWQVRIPASGETCWAWGEYANASGSYESVPESGPTTGGAAGAPARPSSLFFQYTCPFGNLTTNLTWGDAADNEAGYRVYRYDILLADLPANTTAYTDVVTVAPYSNLEYSVEAYNSAGSSASRTISFSCQ